MPPAQARVDSSFLSYYHQPDQRQQQQQSAPPMPSPQSKGQYAFQQPNARQESIRPPQPIYSPRSQAAAPRDGRPYVPNIQVQRPPSPPKAAFVASPLVNSFNEKQVPGSPASLSPHSPIGRKGSGAEEDDRYGSVVGSQTAHMDFWKRFSMTLHDQEMEEKGLKKKQNAWLNKQFEGNRKWKIIVWTLAIVILIVIGATLAWHFTRPDDNSVTRPTTHDFGLSPDATSSVNPLKTLAINAGPAKRSALPTAHVKRMARLRKVDAVS